ncbi:MAG: hypothetical protein KatS3mg081_1945 [Gemmatimonadales bacterium]|nr:MAG: hypothetical protein KatS3mg081_1945 [Gemmatimonadales bacterium]
MIQSRRGFTLIEILIVLAMIGIVAAIAVPRIDLTRYRVDSAMQGIGTTMLVAQRLAVTRQHDVIVRFDVPGAALIVHEDADNDGAVDSGERVRRFPLGEHIVFGRAGAPAGPIPGSGNEVTFTRTVDGMPAVVFHRNGSASEAGGFYLTSKRAVLNPGHETDTRAIEVERGTGRVSWYRYTSGGTWVRGF